MTSPGRTCLNADCIGFNGIFRPQGYSSHEPHNTKGGHQACPVIKSFVLHTTKLIYFCEKQHNDSFKNFNFIIVMSKNKKQKLSLYRIYNPNYNKPW